MALRVLSNAISKKWYRPGSVYWNGDSRERTPEPFWEVNCATIKLSVNARFEFTWRPWIPTIAWPHHQPVAYPGGWLWPTWGTLGVVWRVHQLPLSKIIAERLVELVDCDLLDGSLKVSCGVHDVEILGYDITSVDHPPRRRNCECQMNHWCRESHDHDYHT